MGAQKQDEKGKNGLLRIGCNQIPRMLLYTVYLTLFIIIDLSTFLLAFADPIRKTIRREMASPPPPPIPGKFKNQNPLERPPPTPGLP